MPGLLLYTCAFEAIGRNSTFLFWKSSYYCHHHRKSSNFIIIPTTVYNPLTPLLSKIRFFCEIRPFTSRPLIRPLGWSLKTQSTKLNVTIMSYQNSLHHAFMEGKTKIAVGKYFYFNYLVPTCTLITFTPKLIPSNMFYKPHPCFIKVGKRLMVYVGRHIWATV